MHAAGMTWSERLPVFAPVHVTLVQIAEQLEAVVTFRRRLEGTLPHSHGGDLVVLFVQAQAALDLVVRRAGIRIGDKG